MNWRLPQLAIFISLLFTACVPLVTINSISEKFIDTTTSKHYDSDSQIRYCVSNDDNNLHLNLKTNHPATIAKILRSGLKVYFDKNGKKKKSVYINYPIGSSQDFQHFQTNGPGGSTSLDLKSLIHSTSIAAEFIHFEKKESFTTLNPKSNIQLSITTNETKELVYDLIIPFTEISPNGRADLFNLSIGIVTGSFDLPVQSPLENEAVDRSNAGRPTGGMPQQGASSNRASYGSGRAGGAPHQGYTDLQEESKIWFLVGLYH